MLGWPGQSIQFLPQDCFHLLLLPGHQGWPSSRSCEQEEGNLSQNDMMHYAVIRWRAYKDTLWNPMKKFLKKIGPWKSREWAQIALFGPLGTLKVKVCGDHMFNPCRPFGCSWDQIWPTEDLWRWNRNLNFFVLTPDTEWRFPLESSGLMNKWPATGILSTIDSDQRCYMHLWFCFVIKCSSIFFNIFRYKLIKKTRLPLQ